MAAALFASQSSGLAATYADIENHALSTRDVLIGTPGSITLRQNGSGVQFYARQYYDHEGRKRDQYIGATPGTPDAEKLLADWRARITGTKDAIATVRILVREGYRSITPRHFATLAPLSSHGLFRAGALLVGTHAFDVMVNKLGIRVAGFATEDLDIARPARLALEDTPEGGLLGLLRESGIDFVEVPPLERKGVSVKYKEQGRSRFTVDLLAPASGTEYGVIAVPELQAYATTLPYFKYLISQSQAGAVISSHGVAAVRVPLPERFALHKMIVATLRTSRSEKSAKDLNQAATLIAVLGERHPGALTEAAKATPISMRKHVRQSFEEIRARLEAHPQALQEMDEALSK